MLKEGNASRSARAALLRQRSSLSAALGVHQPQVFGEMQHGCIVIKHGCRPSAVPPSAGWEVYKRIDTPEFHNIHCEAFSMLTVCWAVYWGADKPPEFHNIHCEALTVALHVVLFCWSGA